MAPTRPISNLRRYQESLLCPLSISAANGKFWFCAVIALPSLPTERWTFFPAWLAFASLGREKESGRRRGSGGNEEKEEESAHFSLFGLTPISGISGGVIAPLSPSFPQRRFRFLFSSQSQTKTKTLENEIAENRVTERGFQVGCEERG